MSDDDDEITADALANALPGYKNALWAVMLLNLGYGVVQTAAGFFANSQGLKADALDFIGDGSITFLGLLALNWGAAKRARTALVQGVFLALLGIGVLVNAGYRIFVEETPEADLMILFGLLACTVNLAAAAILMRFREGDANVRAVWLFSRNDALGNLSVVAAAGLVLLTESPAPDLVVAALVGVLFLHSAWEIIQHTKSELNESEGTLEIG